MQVILWIFLCTAIGQSIFAQEVLPPKQAYPLDVRQIHSGHSLTDPLFHPWPGQYRYLIYNIFGGQWDHLGKATIPGSPMFWRWNNEHTLSPSARYDIADWELLVITEGVPIPTDGGNPPLISPAKEYLSQYVNNAWNNGNSGHGAATLLWTTWTNIDDSDGPWRQLLDEYELLWEEMMDYANDHRPEDATPVYIIPGHRMMARLYDDIQANVVPDVQHISDFFSDNIHVNDLGAYAVAMIHYACIYNQSPIGLTNTLFSANDLPGHSIPSEQLAQYLQTMIWDVVTSYPRTGISISSATTPTSTENQFIVYPNPAHDVISIRLDRQDFNHAFRFTIFNTIGEAVYRGSDFQVDISHLVPGCYILKSGNRYSKFIKH